MEGAPLDSTTWPLCVQSPKARLPQLRHQTILQNLHQKVTQFSGKFLGIDYALLPNCEWNQKQKHKKQPWGNVDSPRKRAAEGLCGWRHGNSFPMTQSAQSLRQMRSIPRCSKAVFCVFVFDSIHNSATFHNLSPGMFH